MRKTTIFLLVVSLVISCNKKQEAKVTRFYAEFEAKDVRPFLNRTSFEGFFFRPIHPVVYKMGKEQLEMYSLIRIVAKK
ncbi:hypothetical protein D7D25_17250 [Proteiniphilum sp. X52]|nr:hypothetical protein D7D25_17250 [Proteiniphilum sp. X52]